MSKRKKLHVKKDHQIGFSYRINTQKVSYFSKNGYHKRQFDHQKETNTNCRIFAEMNQNFTSSSYSMGTLTLTP